MNHIWGFILAGVLGVFFGVQVIGAAIIFWPITLVLLWWYWEKRKPEGIDDAVTRKNLDDRTN